MDLVRAVSTLRDAAGMTNQELIDRSGMSASYYYGRLRGAAPFDTNDIENLAHALGTHPHEISRVAASIGDADEIEPKVDTETKELGPPADRDRPCASRSMARRSTSTALSLSLPDRGVALDRDEWSALVGGDPHVAGACSSAGRRGSVRGRP